MLLTQAPNQITGDLGGEKIEYTVDQTALAHIMNVLTELYSDPHKAVVREISTNALDSHAISGQTRPIKITTPSRVNGFFIVEDFGAGMSPDDLRNIYSSYGASTKRGNNVEAGQLGLGSKSPFAIADQFTIRARKDGVETMAMLSRNANRSAQIEIVSEQATDEPNGVRLQIPISGDLNVFNRKVEEFVRYVRPGLVDLNGEVNDVPEHWLKLSDDIYVNTNNRYGEDGYQRNAIVVMGNVAYPADRSSIPSSVIAYVPMGSLAFTPSREELMYIDLTEQTLRSVADDVEALSSAYIAEELSKASTPAEKLAIIDGLSSVTRVHDWAKYSEFTRVFPTMHLHQYSTKVSYDSDQYYYLYRRNGTAISYVVYNCARAKGDRQLFNGIGAGRGDKVVIFDGTEEEARGFFPEATLVNAKKVARKPRQRNTTTTPAIPKETFEDIRGRFVPESSLRGLAKVLYVAKSEYNGMHDIAARKGEHIVFVPPAKQAAFAKKFPNAAKLSDVYHERRAKIEDFVGPRMFNHTSEMAFLSKLGPLLNVIDDDDFNHDVRLAIRTAKMNALGSRWGIYGSAGRLDFPTMDKYPLLKELQRSYYYKVYHLDHIGHYIKGVQDHG